MQNLSQNLNHSELEIRKAAILTLGYICEQLKVRLKGRARSRCP